MDKIIEESKSQNVKELELINNQYLRLLKSQKKILRKRKKEMDPSDYKSKLMGLDSEIEKTKKEMKELRKQIKK